MLRAFFWVMPVFVAAWFARQRCERFKVSGVTLATVLPGVYVRVNE